MLGPDMFQQKKKLLSKTKNGEGFKSRNIWNAACESHFAPRQHFPQHGQKTLHFDDVTLYADVVAGLL
jgi:hypothetical protein